MKKIALAAMMAMLFWGVSVSVVNSQNQPTGAPDTSVTTRPKVQAQPTQPAQPVQSKPAETSKESNGSTTLILIGVAVVVVLGGVALVMGRRNKAKK